MPRRQPDKILINDRGELENHTYRRPLGRPTKWNFSRLEVGDPLFALDHEARSALSAAATYKANNPGWNYISKKAEGGRRFFRIS